MLKSITSRKSLEELTLKQLTEYHNLAAVELGEREVKSFKDKPTALERADLLRMKIEYAAKQAAKAAPKIAPDEPAKTEDKPAKTEPKKETAKGEKATAERPKRGYRFVFAPEALELQRPPREGCRRRIAYDLLAREEGTTHAEIMKAVSLTDRQAYECIRLIHYVHGFGLKQDETGRIWLRTK